jgi:hypothetical protein
MEAEMDRASDGIVIKSGHQRQLGDERVGVSGVVPVAEHDGTVRERAVISTPRRRTEVFVGDEIELGDIRYVVAIDVAAASITLTPCGP